MDGTAAEHGGLPVTARILTRTGFRGCSDVRVGEEVLGFDMAEGLCRWVPLLASQTFAPTPMKRLRSLSFDITAVPNQEWVVVRQAWRVYGIRKRRTSWGPRKIRTARLLTHDRILVAAPAQGGNNPLTPREAAILGWIVTDGHVKYNPSLCVTVSQGKPSRIEELKELLEPDYTGTYWQKGCATFHLRTRFARALFEKAGFETSGDLISLITNMSEPARAAMLGAMLKAEGDGRREFSQKPGPTLEAFRVLATLEGRRLGRDKVRPWGVHTVDLLNYSRAGVADMVISEAPAEAVWCPCTEVGSWVTELQGQITIAGDASSEH